MVTDAFLEMSLIMTMLSLTCKNSLHARLLDKTITGEDGRSHRSRRLPSKIPRSTHPVVSPRSDMQHDIILLSIFILYQQLQNAQAHPSTSSFSPRPINTFFVNSLRRRDSGIFEVEKKSLKFWTWTPFLPFCNKTKHHNPVQIQKTRIFQVWKTKTTWEFDTHLTKSLSRDVT